MISRRSPARANLIDTDRLARVIARSLVRFPFTLLKFFEISGIEHRGNSFRLQRVIRITEEGIHTSPGPGRTVQPTLRYLPKKDRE